MGTERLILRGHAGVGPLVEGLALVSPDGFSARYDLDRTTGTISRASHALFGRRIGGTIFVCPLAKGGFATSWALHDLAARGLAPAGMIFGVANPVMVQGAVLAGIALLDRLDPDPLAVLRTGDRLRLDPAAGTVELLRASRAARLPP